MYKIFTLTRSEFFFFFFFFFAFLLKHLKSSGDVHFITIPLTFSYANI